MILCFGTFASVLNRCKQGLSQDKFIPRIVWVVDSKNRCLGDGLDYEISGDDLETMEMLGNPSVVSKLLSCKQSLNLRTTSRPSLEIVAERFNAKVVPYIDEDKVAKAVLALLRIISKDDTIRTLRRESFRKYLGMYREELLQQTALNVPDFFARLLLYTTNVDNRKGYPDAKEIADDFIEKAAKDSWADVSWDATVQAVKIVHSEEASFFHEVNMLSELYRPLLGEQPDYANMEWLGVDKSSLFPSIYRRVDFKDAETKRMALSKMNQYMKLTHQLVELRAEQQSSKWPIFPDERMRDVRQQLKDLYDELLFLGIFQSD